MAKTQLVQDIADLIPGFVLEELFLGSVRISSVDNDPTRSATRFYALGMAMEGTALTALPATQLVP